MRPASLQLPAQPTPLVGRTAELATIRRRLSDEGARLLTLTGPAGVGKARLALAAAERLTDHFPDGVTLVDLAPIRDPSLVLPAIGHAFGLIDTGQPPLPERLRDVLRERAALLLVLDNFEQVLPAGAALADLLASCPGLCLLVTSRVPLQLRWEQTLRIPPLAVPDLQAALPSPDALAQIPSVALFVERARARRADFILSERTAALVAELVVQLDGLPLALELAATRLDALPLSAIVRRLEDRLHLLASEALDLPERQRSLEAAVGWSYDLLSEPERRLFSCLGVFVGQVTLDAIAAVVQAVGQESMTDAGGERGSGEERRILQRLAALAEKSLVLPGQHDGEGDDPEPAFRVLETVREYAWEQLVAAGELEAARFAHAHYFLALAERAEPQLRERDQRAWFVRLEREQDNLRAALRWLLDQDDPVEREAGLRLAGSLGWFWFVRGYRGEGLRWLGEALTHAPADASAARTRVLLLRGLFFTYQGDLERARTNLEEALALADQRHDPAAVAEALTDLGIQALFAGDPAEGVRLGREALARWEDLGDAYHGAVALYLLGSLAFAQGNDADAIALLLDALKRFEAVQDLRQAGNVRFNLAATVARFGDLPRAVDYVRAGLEAGLALQDRWLLSAGAHAALAIVGERADSAPGAQLLGAVDALSQAMGATFSWERMPQWTSVVRLRERIERGEWGAAYREGRSLPYGEVAALALRLLEEIAQALPQRDAVPESVLPPPHPSQPPDPLSAREREVLRLVAQGRSSKAIGQQLFLSPSTVNQHLTSVFHKLGVNTRAQAVAVAAQRSLL